MSEFNIEKVFSHWSVDVNRMIKDAKLSGTETNVDLFLIQLLKDSGFSIEDFNNYLLSDGVELYKHTLDAFVCDIDSYIIRRITLLSKLKSLLFKPRNKITIYLNKQDYTSLKNIALDNNKLPDSKFITGIVKEYLNNKNKSDEVKSNTDTDEMKHRSNKRKTIEHPTTSCTD